MTLLRVNGSLRASGSRVLPGQEINAIHAASKNRIWFASGGRIGWIDHSMRVTWLSATSDLLTEPALAILQDGGQRLWVRTSRHMLRLDPGASRFQVDAADLPPANDVGSPALDHEGHVMVPTISGLYIHRGDHWEVVDKHRGTASNAVLSVMQDREGTYWLGFGGNGIQRWQGGRTWSGWTDAEGLPDNVVWTEMRDHIGRLWIGTNNGVAMWDGASHHFHIWTRKSGINGSTARSLAETRDGAVWVLCHPGGLTRFAPGSLHPERIPLLGADPTSIAAGPDGRLWISGPHYFKVLRSERQPFVFESIPAPPELAEFVAHFDFTKDGTVWACGRKALARRKDGHWQRFGQKDGLTSDGMVQVVGASADEAWVRYADASGITRIRLRDGQLQVSQFGSAQGLASDEVYMMGLDRTGNLWAGGPNGLARISPEGQVRRYGHSDGLIWEDQSEGGFFAESDGTLLFGTSGGLARFDPAAERALPNYPANVVFTSVQMGGRERFGDDHPQVTHKENTLRAEFAVLSYRDPANVRCSYKLNGLESDFTESTMRELRYPALAPGSYDLEASCKSAAGIAGEPAHFGFTVLPAWWQQWWTRGLALMAFVLGLYGILRFRTYSLEKDRQRLERAVAERSKELEYLNQELREAALTDPLTGTRNRRFFQMTIEGDVNQAIRSYQDGADAGPSRNRDLIFYLIDADHFKQVNDAYGHDAGDELLLEMTRRISCAIRQSDILIRWGGEEFLVVSRYTERDGAKTLAARILKSIGSEPFHLPQVHDPVHKTCSIGWAAFPWFRVAPDGVSYETVLAMADQALYAAKQSGRNRAIGLLAEVEDASLAQSAKTPNPEQLPASRVTVLGPENTRSATSGV